MITQRNVRRFWQWIPFGIIFLVASVVRVWQLAQFPRGLQFDETWFGYNALLIAKRGMNIYSERWPLTVDFFGDFVPAMHSYVTAPFVLLLGLNGWAIRLPFALASLLTLLLISVWLWRQTKNAKLVGVFGILFAVSPLNVVMSRASSTVILDTLVVILFLGAMWKAGESVVKLGIRNRISILWLMASYGLSVTAYWTYFSSRLLIVPFGLVLTALLWTRYQKEWRRLLWLLVPLAVYVVFPFLILLPTHYALGRFAQTTILRSKTVQNDLTNTITRSGQGGLPPLITRAAYNKVGENGRAWMKQYVEFLSPRYVIDGLEKPPRYRMPRLGPYTVLEYFGVVVAVGFLLARARHARSRDGDTLQLHPLAAAALVCTLLALVPTSLTSDDWPNWQRAVIMTPFWQVTAAVGLTLLIETWLPKMRTNVALAGMGVLALPTIFGLYTNYTIHARYQEPFFRDVPQMEVGRWINTNAHDAPLLVSHRGLFLAPHFLNEEILLDWPIKNAQKNFLFSPEFWIGNRHFVHDLCFTENVLDESYEYFILYVHEQSCGLPWWMTKVADFSFEGGSPAFVIGKPDTQQQEQYAQKLKKLKPDSPERASLFAEIWQKEKPQND